MPLTSQKNMHSGGEPHQDIKAIGDQMAYKKDNKDTSQNHMEPRSSTPNVQRSKSCTILWIHVLVVIECIVIYTWKMLWILGKVSNKTFKGIVVLLDLNSVTSFDIYLSWNFWQAASKFRCLKLFLSVVALTVQCCDKSSIFICEKWEDISVFT